MPFNGSGTFTLVAGNPVVTGTVISSTVHNNTNNDFATGFTNCITRDGQSAALANLPMGGFKHTGAAAASGINEYLTYGQTGANLSSLTVGTFTTTGNANINGNVTLGDAAADTLTINPNTVTWAGTPVTHSGAHAWSGVQTYNANPAGRVIGDTYTPTLANDLNANTLTTSGNTWKYVRVGKTVHVAGYVQTNAGVTGQCRFTATLPVASNFANTGDLAGSGTHYIPGTASVAVRIQADTTNDVALFAFPAPITSAMVIMFSFSYEVI
jgi:hypothetical protein